MSLAKNEEVIDKNLSDDELLSENSSLASDIELEDDEKNNDNEEEIDSVNDSENEDSENEKENIIRSTYLDESEDEEDLIEEDEIEISDDEENLQKLEEYFVASDLEKMHPEIKSVNFDEVSALTRITKDQYGKIIDPLHTTIPFITKYEKARIIGARSEQIDRGAPIYVDVESHIINARTIAQLEFDEKKIPFIIARPLPNKSVEYWKVSDLENL